MNWIESDGVVYHPHAPLVLHGRGCGEVLCGRVGWGEV